MSDATVLHKGPCPSCGSHDANAFYSDGGEHCFSMGCSHHVWGTKKNGEHLTDLTDVFNTEKEKDWTPLEVDVRAVPGRHITKETCEAWGYGWTEVDGALCHVASYRDEKGKLVAQKVRAKGKQFSIVGSGKNMPLYGQWRQFTSSKHIVITEGELDALSMSQAQDNKWPVVSLPNGAQSAVKAVTNAYDWLLKFDRIVLMFDMDAAGQEAAEKVAALLPPGKAAIASLTGKDANEVLMEKGPAPLIRSFWDAKLWRPDGIKHAKDIRDAFLNPPEVRGIPYPWHEWNEVLGQMRLGALVTLTAGTGIGKSTLLRELLYHALVTHGQAVGALFLEESNVETMEALVGIALDKNIMMDRSLASKEDTAAAYELLIEKPLYLYDHFGSNEVDNVCEKIRYLAKVCGVNWIFLDHISILVSGLEGDERRTLDMAMTKLNSLANELNIGLFCVVHLKRPSGDLGHEDGAEVHLGQLRGSHSIAQLSHAVVALNKSKDDPHGFNVTPVCIKNRRNGGRKGPMGTLTYSRDTGRLSDCVF